MVSRSTGTRATLAATHDVSVIMGLMEVAAVCTLCEENLKAHRKVPDAPNI